MAWARDLARLSAALGKAGRLPGEVATRVEAGIKDDLREKFDRGRDPEGRPWPPRKQEPADGHPLLYRSGELYGSLDVEAHDDGTIEVGYQAPYSGYVNDGTATTPARRLVPDAVPERWRTLLQRELKAALEELLERGGWTRRRGRRA